MLTSNSFPNMYFCAMLMLCVSSQMVIAQTQVHQVSVSKQDPSLQKIDQLVSQYELIPLHLPNGEFISEISKIASTDQFIYVMDEEMNRLYQFDREGYFIQLIGKMGEGFDEYRDISDFDIDENGNIYILSNRSWGFFKYSSDGRFLQKISSGTTAVSKIGVLDQDHILCASNHFDEDNHNVLILDKRGKIRKKLHPYPKDRYQMSFNAITGGFIRSRDRILYAEAASCNLYSLKLSKGQIVSEKLFQLDLGKDMWPCEDHSDLEKFWNTITKLPEDLAYLSNHFHLSDRYLLFNFTHKLRNRNALYSLSTGRVTHLYDLPTGLLQLAIKNNPVKGIDENRFIFGIDEELWFYLKKEAEKIGFLPAIDDTFMKELPKMSGDGNDPPYLLFVQFK